MKKQSDLSVEVPVFVEKDVPLPLYATEGASGADVHAALDEDLVVQPGTSVLVPTGLKFAIPPGLEIQVRPRSGLALRHQITVLNAPGTIDADYRGELSILLINHGKQPFIIVPGMRIAQIVLAPVLRAEFTKKEALETTARAERGFGHTGLCLKPDSVL